MTTTDPWVLAEHPEIQSAPLVERVVSDDGLNYTVTVRFHARDNTERMLDALERHLGRTFTDHLPKGSAERAAALRWIETDPAVAAAFTFTMAGGTAEDLAHQLDDASTAPERCSLNCDRYGEADTTHGWLCNGHAAAADEFDGIDREDWDEAN